ncbi:MAG: DUF4328 domain-containing protein [Actinomycetes bacterium]
MRAKKPAASTADACHRCTAIMLSGAVRCTLCGWPAGQGYPPGDDHGDHSDHTASLLDAEPEVEDQEVQTAPEVHADAQFDALAAMVERRTAPAVEPEPIEAELAAAEVFDTPSDTESDTESDADNGDGDASTETVDAIDEQRSLESPALVMASVATTTEDFDPLTAPFEQVTGGGRLLAGGPSAPLLESPNDGEGPDNVHDVDWIDDSGDAVTSSEATDQPDGPAAQTPATGALTSKGRLASALIVAVPVLTLASSFVPWPVGALLAFVTLTAWVAAGVLFLLWVRLARETVTELSSVPQRWSPTLSVVGWLIPLAGLYIGWQVLQDLWHGSEPTTEDDAPEATSKKASPQLITGWLAALVVSLLLSVLGGPVLPQSLVIDLASTLLLLGSALCLAGVVGQISLWQDAATDGALPDDTTIDAWPNPAG